MLVPLATTSSISGYTLSCSGEPVELTHRRLHALTLAMDAQYLTVGVQLEEVVHAFVRSVFVVAVNLDAWFIDRSRYHLGQHGFELGGLSSAAVNCATREIVDMS